MDTTDLRTRAFVPVLLLVASCSAERADGPQPSRVQVMPAESAQLPAPSARPTALPETPPLTGVHFADAEEPRPLLSLEIVLTDDVLVPQMTGHDGHFWGPYVSEDGTLELVAEPDPVVALGIRVRTYGVDSGALAEEARVVDDPPCEPMSRRTCDKRALERSVGPANAVLKRHRWAPFRRFFPLPYVAQVDWCEGEDVARHFEVAGYEVHFTPPHLRIVQARSGVTVVDKDFPWQLEQRKSAGGCTRPNPTTFSVGGIDAQRRTMFASMQSCKHQECGGQLWVHFFRLPPPLAP